MADQMMAAGQADALNAMLKDVPIGRLVARTRLLMLFFGFAAPPQAWWSATRSLSMADTRCIEDES